MTEDTMLCKACLQPLHYRTKMAQLMHKEERLTRAGFFESIMQSMGMLRVEDIRSFSSLTVALSLISSLSSPSLHAAVLCLMCSYFGSVFSCLCKLFESPREGAAMLKWPVKYTLMSVVALLLSDSARVEVRRRCEDTLIGVSQSSCK